jgi:tight adherence protein B
MSAMLQTAAEDPVGDTTKLLREMAPNKRPFLEAWLERLSLLGRLEALIRQAGVDWKPVGLLGVMAGGACVGMVLAAVLPPFLDRAWEAPALAAPCAALPYLYLRSKRKKRLDAFEEQFPEALDFLARSMRAGHAFTISLKMVSEDSPEPLGTEFRTLFNQQNLGVPIDTALFNLAERIPLLDVRFFGSAVILQKQTGGNLGEILTRLSQVIRERFQLKGKVKAASAHGRVTSLVLVILPLATTLAMMALAPAYLKTMVADPDGKWLIGGAVAGQFLGQMVIRKIVNIKV